MESSGRALKQAHPDDLCLLSALLNLSGFHIGPSFYCWYERNLPYKGRPRHLFEQTYVRHLGLYHSDCQFALWNSNCMYRNSLEVKTWHGRRLMEHQAPYSCPVPTRVNDATQWCFQLCLYAGCLWAPRGARRWPQQKPLNCNLGCANTHCNNDLSWCVSSNP